MIVAHWQSFTHPTITQKRNMKYNHEEMKRRLDLGLYEHQAENRAIVTPVHFAIDCLFVLVVAALGVGIWNLIF